MVFKFRCWSKRLAVVATLVTCGGLLLSGLPGPVVAWAGQASTVGRVCPRPGVWSVSARACVDNGFGVPDGVRVKRASSKSLRLSWKPVKDADGYRVYRWTETKQRYVAAVTLKSGKAKAWKDKSLRPHKIYRYVVRSFHVVKSKRLWSEVSYWVSAITSRDKDELVNATNLDMDNTASLGIFGTGKLIAKAVPDDMTWVPGKLARPIRWQLLSGKDVIKVSQSGRVTAIKPGRAVVRAMAHNGITRKIVITVGDYSHPAAFNLNSFYAHKPFQLAFLKNFRVLVGQLTLWFTNHNITSEDWLELDEDGKVIGPVNQLDNYALNLVTRLLWDYPYPIKIQPDGRNVSYWTASDPIEPDHISIFRYSPTIQYPTEPQNRQFDIAPHWDVGDSPVVY